MYQFRSLRPNIGYDKNTGKIFERSELQQMFIEKLRVKCAVFEVRMKIIGSACFTESLEFQKQMNFTIAR